jgi:hypothetical protein
MRDITKKCIVKDCDKFQFCREMCKSCYDTWYSSTTNGRLRKKISQEKVRKTNTRRAYTKDYNQKYKFRRNLLRAERKKTDIQYVLAEALRKRLYSVIKHKLKTGSAVNDLGCTLDYLKKYLESKFQLGMSWDNYGRKAGIQCWEIDHIKPLKSFNLEDKTQFLMACHYTNLQPLWAEENNKKRAKILEENVYADTGTKWID